MVAFFAQLSNGRDTLTSRQLAQAIQAHEEQINNAVSSKLITSPCCS